MKKLATILTALIIIATIFWAFEDAIPSVKKEITTKNATEFNLQNALHHLKNISQQTHYVGSEGHKDVQNYIVGELKKIGLEPQIQTQTAVNKKWTGATTTENILAKIKGSSRGKALLLLSHYDSNPHAAIGASDAGSGVVTILEGIRAYLAQHKTPKNDIIILISDAEELGLLGAQAFVDHHPWAKDVGLVLNFEARGSGGPSYMLMETNGKNGKLIKEFIKADVAYPQANSLMYSIYKKLPNDTDLTVFREDANINGFNFAFIGDHFDYHTAQDNFERLDRASLLHQADYFTKTVQHFANANLSNFVADADFVYVNFPVLKLISYPFAWIKPMLIIAIIFFVLFILTGLALNRLDFKEILKGFIPFILCMLLCTISNYLLWKLLLTIHNGYKDILHGFTYNGYTYILAFAFLNIWLCYACYVWFAKQTKPIHLLIAPLFIWLIINAFIANTLQGAGFFIIPVFIGLLILLLAIFTNFGYRTQKVVFTIISIPTIYIFAPMVQLFPLGLGLKNLFISGIIISLLFGLLIFSLHLKSTKWPFRLSGLAAVFCFAWATYNSGFNTHNKKPNSLVYVQNNTNQQAYFGTYNKTLDAFTKAVFTDKSIKGSIKNAETKSKYNTKFTYHIATQNRNIPFSNINYEIDTNIGDYRMVEITIKPQSKVNKYEFITRNPIDLEQFKVNGALVVKGNSYKIKRGSFLIYYMATSDKELTLSFKTKNKAKLPIIINQISYDLLQHPQFDIAPRTAEMMPMPFVTNDAIIVTKEIEL